MFLSCHLLPAEVSRSSSTLAHAVWTSAPLLRRPPAWANAGLLRSSLAHGSYSLFRGAFADFVVSILQHFPERESKDGKCFKLVSLECLEPTLLLSRKPGLKSFSTWVVRGGGKKSGLPRFLLSLISRTSQDLFFSSKI